MMTYDGAILTLYRDGKAVATKSGGAGTLAVYAQAVEIGRYYHGANLNGQSYYFSGLIDDVRIYNRALSDQEVRDLYAYEAPESPWITLEVKTVEVTLHVTPTKTYQLEASSDLVTWTKVGSPFLATTSEVTEDFDATDVGRYFRIYEVQ
jgi:hypothetical protein